MTKKDCDIEVFKRLPDEEKLKAILYLRITKLDQFLLKQEASRRGTTLSALLRERIFKKEEEK